jgi:hypothetical protein
MPILQGGGWFSPITQSGDSETDGQHDTHHGSSSRPGALLKISNSHGCSTPIHIVQHYYFDWGRRLQPGLIPGDTISFGKFRNYIIDLGENCYDHSSQTNACVMQTRGDVGQDQVKQCSSERNRLDDFIDGVRRWFPGGQAADGA